MSLGTKAEDTAGPILGTLDNLSRLENLRDIFVEIYIPTITKIVHFLHHPVKFPELEKMLLHFSQPKIGFSVDRPINVHRYHSWREHVKQCFPALAMRNAVTFKAKSCA